MKNLLIIFFSALGLTSHGQIVFSETFDELDDATTGVDAIGGVVWNTTTPGAVDADDYFKVLGNKLEAKDTNEPGAYWETDDIDVSTCVGTLITFDYTERGTMEDCADCPGDGLGCIDWLKLEYNVDGLGWVEVAGATCPATVIFAPGEMIQIGDVLGGATVSYNSPCIDFGSTLRLRITVQCWAASEFWEVDNVSVECLDCVLPVELANLETAQIGNSGTRISWLTNSERDNDYFEIQRSTDGHYFQTIGYMDGAGNSSDEIAYQFDDFSNPTGQLLYYRLKQVNFNGSFTYSDAITFKRQLPANIWYSNGVLHVTFNQDSGNEKVPLIIYDLSGKIVEQLDISENTSIPWTHTGFFIMEIPAINFTQKIATF